MPYLILLLLLIALVSVATLYLIEEPGYIFLQWGVWQIELSLALAVVAVLLFLLALYVVFEVVAGVAGIPGRLTRSYFERREQKTQVASAKGLMYLVEGDWSRAEKHLQNAAKRFPEPVMLQLATAYAAQKNGSSEKRDACLKEAAEAGKEYHSVVALVTCKLQMERGATTDAIEGLMNLCSMNPKNGAAFRLLVEAYQQIGAWSAVYELLPHLKKSQALSDSQFNLLTLVAIRHRLSTVDSATELLQLRKRISVDKQRDPDIAVTYVKKLLEFERYQEAEKVIRATLEFRWYSELAYLYAFIKGNMDDHRLYETALKWVREHPEDPDLLLTAGKLAKRNSLWGKAQGFLEDSIKLGGRTEASAELGEMLESKGQSEQAFAVYKSGATTSPE